MAVFDRMGKEDKMGGSTAPACVHPIPSEVACSRLLVRHFTGLKIALLNMHFFYRESIFVVLVEWIFQALKT